MIVMSTVVERVDRAVLPAVRRWGIPALRVSLGTVFIWFGLLKVIGESPVVELVASTVYWVDPDWFVPALGVVETAVGVCLILRLALRIVLAVLVLQLAGTFLVFLILPDVAFTEGNPLLLTTEGEFIVKNLVLLTAAMVVGTRLDQPTEDV